MKILITGFIGSITPRIISRPENEGLFYGHKYHCSDHGAAMQRSHDYGLYGPPKDRRQDHSVTIPWLRVRLQGLRQVSLAQRFAMGCSSQPPQCFEIYWITVRLPVPVPFRKRSRVIRQRNHNRRERRASAADSLGLVSLQGASAKP
jgi:hypothetical protein